MILPILPIFSDDDVDDGADDDDMDDADNRLNMFDPGVIGMYCPIGMRPGRQKYPTRLSGWVVHIISRPPFAKTSTH